MIAQYLQESQRTWDELLPGISLAINSSISNSTGFSPSYLVLGRKPHLPRNLYDEVTPGIGSETRGPEDQAHHRNAVIQAAKENMQQATEGQRRHYDLRRREWRPQLGAVVLVKQHHLSKAADGFSAKLARKFNGSFKVVRFISPNIVRRQTSVT
ncbi:uncharacterized protein LOC122319856 [Drosophila ficusphila]|uniref:uncharacterized protein LOC122319856 n=1 Tax=Drosophila ficusphila TaxID=30025 RepID=UPI001C8A7377|nr:uncharacterized protein LOC122319856 [Drosophila ficusphila]